MGVKSKAKESNLSRREREESLRREIILEAAEKVIGAKGFRGAAMEEIAREAQLSAGSLYNAFANKEELYRVLLVRRSERLLDRMRSRLSPDMSAARALETVIETLLEHFNANRNFFIIFLEATSGFSWHIRKTLGEEALARYQEFIKTVAEIFRSGIASGEIPEADPEHLAVAFMGGLNGYVTQWVSTDPGVSLIDLIPSAKTVLLRLAQKGS
jgi:AcrR family transcriptional regulator